MTRCQLCGRRHGLRKDGTIRFHNAAGAPCGGAGHPPIERSDARLVEALEAAQAAERATLAELTALYDRRANYIDPAITGRLYRESRFADRLARRLKRHRAWPARFARQMETQGWGDPPPAYLISR